MIILKNHDNKPEAIVLAVPYLRDRDIRTVEPGETIEDKSNKIIEGIKNHYEDVAQIAEKYQKQYGEIPMIGMGHLFTSGAKTIENDGVRDLYVGSLAHIDRNHFPESIDYIALGHLHIPQKVGGSENIRYSGSPIPIGFGEAKQKKIVLVIDFDRRSPETEEIEVPLFHKLMKIKGSYEQIAQTIQDLIKNKEEVYLEIEHTGDSSPGNLRSLINDLVEGSDLEVLKITDKRSNIEILRRAEESESLEDLDTYDIFKRKLETAGIPENEWQELIDSYTEIVNSLHEEDLNAE